MLTIELLSDALLKSLPLDESAEDKDLLLENRRKAINEVLLKHIKLVGAFNDHEKNKYELLKDTKEFKDYLDNSCSDIITKELINTNIIQKRIAEEQEGVVRSIYLAYVLDTDSFNAAKAE